MQATFFIALAVAARLGTATLAAHQIVAQLWLLTSYVTDGFAVAGTVLGSRLSPQRHATADSSDVRYVTCVSSALFCMVPTVRDCTHWEGMLQTCALTVALRLAHDMLFTPSIYTLLNMVNRLLCSV